MQIDTIPNEYTRKVIGDICVAVVRRAANDIRISYRWRRISNLIGLEIKGNTVIGGYGAWKEAFGYKNDTAKTAQAYCDFRAELKYLSECTKWFESPDGAVFWVDCDGEQILKTLEAEAKKNEKELRDVWERLQAGEVIEIDIYSDDKIPTWFSDVQLMKNIVDTRIKRERGHRRRLCAKMKALSKNT